MSKKGANQAQSSLLCARVGAAEIDPGYRRLCVRGTHKARKVKRMNSHQNLGGSEETADDEVSAVHDLFVLESLPGWNETALGYEGLAVFVDRVSQPQYPGRSWGTDELAAYNWDSVRYEDAS
jgi:hypothetical protein